MAEPTTELQQDNDDGDEVQARTRDPSDLTFDLTSYALGCVFGRWDIRLGAGTRSLPELPDPFDPLLTNSPGTLPPGPHPEFYPIAADADGILVDDPNHPDDVVRRVRDVLEVLFPHRAEPIEQEMCHLLGVKDLRAYFSSSGQFFASHIRQYSRSRRKAPIYWLLQSANASYSLWLYYHRLDKDTLFKALTLYVEPKIRLEENQLQALQVQRAGAASGGPGVRQIEKAIERQEALLSDIHDFRDRLKRAADLGLVPDRDDGVILTMAPLWELVPWKEPKAYWEELLAGKYEWSSIGKQLREKGMVAASS